MNSGIFCGPSGSSFGIGRNRLMTSTRFPLRSPANTEAVIDGRKYAPWARSASESKAPENTRSRTSRICLPQQWVSDSILKQV